MAGLQEYKCPCCGGAIAFDSTAQKMKCPYCDSEFEMEALASYDNELKNQQEDQMDWELSDNAQWQDGEANGLKTYVCESCGGEMIADENTAATSCPFCGNPVVVMGQFSGALKPDYVIPFKLDKKAAKEALHRHYGGKRFLPKVFQDQNHIDEVKGVYVPFWLFNADAAVNARFKTTRIQTWSDSDYYYTKTSYYAVTRGGSIGFERVPVDGSSKMADDLMESIEPFDFSEAVDFQTAYLAGYLADKYDVDAAQSMERANERIKKSAEQNFRQTVQGYASVIPEAMSVQLQNGKAKYALYPVWLLNTTWEGKQYTFAMNGQTGKMVGDLPLDKGTYRKWLFGLWAAASAVVFGISYLLWML
ncbi:MAG: zinc ribbon-containing protein [Lachnospiraceae bacterium]|nr:zinc ribbon-containing protein [Lachnospiraceae bacterium]